MTYSSDEWTELAARFGFASEAAMWRALYGGADGSLSIIQLAEKLSLGTQTVRRRLLKAGLAVRSRGGERRPGRCPVLPPAELDLILSEGIAAAARRLSTPYYLLYRRVRKTLKLRRLAALDKRTL